MANFTSGEWGVATIDGGAGNDEICTFVNGCTVNIAEVFGAAEYSEARPFDEVEPTYTVSKEEAAANAALIASAPDLLDACKKMLVCISGDPRFYAEEAFAVVVLEKATGESCE